VELDPLKGFDVSWKVAKFWSGMSYEIGAGLVWISRTFMRLSLLRSRDKKKRGLHKIISASILNKNLGVWAEISRERVSMPNCIFKLPYINTL